MHKIIILITIFWANIALAQAQNNEVYINLSALDSLKTNTIESNAPLFPVFKKQPKIETKAKAKPIAQPKPKVIKKPKPETKKPEEAKKPEAIPFVESEEEVVVVDVEPITNKPEPKPASIAKPEPVLKTVPKPEPASITESEPKAKVILPKEAANSLLIESQTPPKPTQVDNKILFANEITILDDAQKSQIDAVINSFTDIENNKIAIYSYNFDNGVDSFRKKRQSLNRAIEVRNHLLQKGYKDFSIKVLNIDASSDKINSVIIEELK